MVGTPNVGKVKTTKQTYKWLIPSDSLHIRNIGDSLESAEFSTHGANNKWKMRLYPKGYNGKHEDYFAVIIYNCSKKKVTAAVSISIINCNYEEIARDLAERHEFESCDYISNHCTFRKFVKRDFVMIDPNDEILTDGKLTIQCKIALSPVRSERLRNLKRKLDQMDMNLQRVLKIQKLENLMNDKEYSDVSFLVDGKSFKAHKCILARESPVFDAMFKTDMKEKQLNEVVIEDIGSDVFEEMLRYVYVGEVNDIDLIAGDLLAAADKYAIDELKLRCGKSLIDNLSVDSAVESLVIADRYYMKQFKAKIIEFITSHSADIVKAPSFKLLTDIPHVLYDVCLAIGMKK